MQLNSYIINDEAYPDVAVEEVNLDLHKSMDPLFNINVQNINVDRLNVVK